MKEFIYGLSQYPDGVKAFFIFWIIVMVVSGAAAIYLTVKEYNDEHLDNEFWIRRKGRKK